MVNKKELVMSKDLQTLFDEQSKLRQSYLNRGPLGYKHTPEARAKIGETQKGKTVSERTRITASITHKGKVVSEETRAKMREAKKDLIMDREHCAKISRALTGKRHSAETRAKLSEANCGSKRVTVTPKGVFKSRSAAARAYGVIGTTIAAWTKKYPDQFYYINGEV
jgi:hypothetical protein